MRPSNKSRSRNKSGNQGGSLHHQQNRRNGGNVVNRVFDSAGPDGKVRGTPQQIIDKYLGLARDAQLAGDRVMTENLLQHAEHYSRMLGEAQRAQNEARGPNADRDDAARDEEMRDQGGRDPGEREDRGQRSEARDTEGRGGRRDQAGQDAVEQGERDGSGRDQRGREPAFSSGFATIDPEDVEDPRDAPQARDAGSERQDRRETRPAAGINGASHPEPDAAQGPAEAPDAAAKPAAPKRTRTRRKAPAAEPASSPAAQAD